MPGERGVCWSETETETLPVVWEGSKYHDFVGGGEEEKKSLNHNKVSMVTPVNVSAGRFKCKHKRSS